MKFTKEQLEFFSKEELIDLCIKLVYLTEDAMKALRSSKDQLTSVREALEDITQPTDDSVEL